MKQPNRLLIENILTQQYKKQFRQNPFGKNHVTAWNNDHPIALIIKGLAAYADDYAKRYEQPLASDYILGDAWADSLKAVRIMLNGEIGHLDGGCCDEIIVALAKNNGFTDEID